MHASNSLIESHPQRLLARVSFIDFIRHVWPWYIIEEVHLLLAHYLERVVLGLLDRLMIFMPPRAGKSTMSSVLFPAFWLGHYPDDKVMQVMYGNDLAKKHGRDCRDLIRSPEYREIFPEVQVSNVSSAADAWKIAQARGEYNAFGLTQGIAGTGWNLGSIDDPLSEQDAFSQVAKDYAWNWYGPGFYTRRQPERSAIVYTGTRWAHDDLAGHLLDVMQNPKPGFEDFVDKWTICDVPAILDGRSARRMNDIAALDNFLGDDTRHFEPGDSFSPRRWTLKELNRQHGQMPERMWLALYQQAPTAEEGQIIKRNWWRQWMKPAMPQMELVIQVYDTAFEEKEKDDPSARTTWGLFPYEDRLDHRAGGRTHYCMMLLEAWEDRVLFPELRTEAVKSAKHWDPDLIIIEGKASGKPLVQEMKKLRLPVMEWSPLRDMRGRELGKIPRTHAASVVWEQGAVFYPNRRWVDKVIDQCAKFPGDKLDDIHDTCMIAALWLRRNFWTELVDELEAKEDAKDRAEQDRHERRRLYG